MVAERTIKDLNGVELDNMVDVSNGIEEYTGELISILCKVGEALIKKDGLVRREKVINCAFHPYTHKYKSVGVKIYR